MQGRRRAIRVLLTIIFVLFIAIQIGTRIGDRVRSISANQSAAADILPTPVPGDTATLSPAQSGWKHVQVIAVATDPAFPDPRVTPTPEPVPTEAPPDTPPPEIATPTPQPVRHYNDRPIWERHATSPAPAVPTELRPSSGHEEL